MNAQALVPIASDRLLWERAAIESHITARAVVGAADLARQEEAGRAASILRQLGQAVAQPTFDDADVELTRFAGAARRAHYLHSAAVVEAIVERASQLVEAQGWVLPTLSEGAVPTEAARPLVEFRR